MPTSFTLSLTLAPGGRPRATQFVVRRDWFETHPLTPGGIDVSGVAVHVGVGPGGWGGGMTVAVGLAGRGVAGAGVVGSGVGVRVGTGVSGGVIAGGVVAGGVVSGAVVSGAVVVGVVGALVVGATKGEDVTTATGLVVGASVAADMPWRLISPQSSARRTIAMRLARRH